MMSSCPPDTRPSSTASRSTGNAASLRPVEVTLAAAVGSRRVCCRNQDRIVTAAIQLVQTGGLELRNRHRDARIEPVTHIERGLQGLAVQGDLQLFDQCGDGPQRHADIVANTSSIRKSKRK